MCWVLCVKFDSTIYVNDLSSSSTLQVRWPNPKNIIMDAHGLCTSLCEMDGWNGGSRIQNRCDDDEGIEGR